MRFITLLIAASVAGCAVAPTTTLDEIDIDTHDLEISVLPLTQVTLDEFVIIREILETSISSEVVDIPVSGQATYTGSMYLNPGSIQEINTRIKMIGEATLIADFNTNSMSGAAARFAEYSTEEVGGIDTLTLGAPVDGTLIFANGEIDDITVLELDLDGTLTHANGIDEVIEMSVIGEFRNANSGTANYFFGVGLGYTTYDGVKNYSPIQLVTTSD